MVDSIVSVRMPSSLVQKLKTLSKENHFLDVSEELRSIIRSKSEEYSIKPAKTNAQQSVKRQQAVAHIQEKGADAAKQEFLQKLKDLIKEIEDE